MKLKRKEEQALTNQMHGYFFPEIQELIPRCITIKLRDSRQVKKREI